MSPVDLDKLLKSVDPSRRGFMKTLILGTAYASPLVTSFGMAENEKGGTPVPRPLGVLCSNLMTDDPAYGASAEIVVNKSASPDSAGPGEQLTFILEIFNCGPSAGTNVVISDQLPSGAKYVSSSRLDAGAAGFDLLEPSVGSEAGLWQAVAAVDFPVEGIAIFEIVLEVLP